MFQSILTLGNNKNMWHLLFQLRLTLSGPGGGGSEAQMAKLTAANQKPL